MTPKRVLNKMYHVKWYISGVGEHTMYFGFNKSYAEQILEKLQHSGKSNLSLDVVETTYGVIDYE